MHGKISIWIFAIIGAAIVGATALGLGGLSDPHGLLKNLYLSNVWTTWHLAAAAWSFCFGFYYLLDYKLGGNDQIDKFLIIILTLASLIIPAVIFWEILSRNTWWAILLTLALNIFYTLFDLTLSKVHCQNERKREYREAFLLADIPIALSSSVFVMWLFFHRVGEWEVFASGIVAVQLISCNTIFVISQAGFVRRIWSKSPTGAQAAN